jgi:cytochrome P450
MDPKNFHDPWSFKPERWFNPKLKSLDDPEASQPFSLGPRGCMGRRYVQDRVPVGEKRTLLMFRNSMDWMEIRSILVKLHFAFDMKLVDQDLD